MAKNKPTKPTNLMPRSFGGEKNNFSDNLITNGFETNIPETYNGDNLNYQLNATGKEFEYVESVVDYIVAMPSNNILTVNSNNQLDYLNANTLAVDNNVVHKTGDETVAGTKTFNNTIIGSVNGNANTATNDIDGNPIKTTYQKVSNLSQVINESETNYPSNKAVKTAIDAKDSLPSQAGNAGKFLTTDGTNASWDYLTSLPVGTIFPCVCSANWTPENALPVDGSEYSSSQFPTLWSEYLTSETPKLVTCTYDEYSSDITTYGQSAKFAVDTMNNKFKVPTIKDGSYITQALSGSEIAKAYKESLPNIKGEISKINFLDQNSSSSGAFSLQFSEPYNYSGGNVDKNNYKVYFNASNSSSVYADNAKVQGDNVRLRWFVVVANGTVSQSAMDWSAWATSLNGKLNKDHSNDEKPYITEVSDKSLMPSWYRVWSDGWCEQGGRGSRAFAHNAEFTITFLKAFSNANNYLVFHGGSSAKSNASLVGFELITRTTTSYTAKYNAQTGGNYTLEYDWYVCGY